MFGAIGNVLGAAKDRAAEAAIKSYLRAKISKFGEVTRLELDSKNKRIGVELNLDGEVSPIQLNVNEYELFRKNGEHYVVLRSVDCSRKWLATALQEYVIGRQFKVPPAAGSVL